MRGLGKDVGRTGGGGNGARKKDFGKEVTGRKDAAVTGVEVVGVVVVGVMVF